MNERGTQSRNGGLNLAERISRSAIFAGAPAPVEFEISFVDVTSPFVFTMASYDRVAQDGP